MNLSNKALLFLLALTSTSVEAFTPASYRGLSPNQVSQAAQNQMRYAPALLSSFDDNNNNEDAEDSNADIDDPPAEDYLVNVGELEGDDQEDVGLEDDGEPPAWYSLQKRIEETRNQLKRHENDTGSPEYQVAGMTERISYLTNHLKQHPKDFSTRRGLVALVNKRRRLLNYLSKESEERYANLIQSLGIRHRAPGRVFSRAEKYGQYPPQKAVKKHLVKK